MFYFDIEILHVFDDLLRFVRYLAMYSYLVFISLNQTQGSVLQGLNPNCNKMSWILFDHLRTELFRPYRALWVTRMGPCNSSNSGPAIMYIFSFVVASSYALPIPAPQTSILFNLARKTDNVNLVETTSERCYLLSHAATNSAVLSPSCLHAKTRCTLIFWYP